MTPAFVSTFDEQRFNRIYQDGHGICADLGGQEAVSFRKINQLIEGLLKDKKFFEIKQFETEAEEQLTRSYLTYTTTLGPGSLT